MDDAEARILAVRPREGEGASDHMAKHVMPAFDQIEAFTKKRDGMDGVDTGFDWLNQVTRGIRPEIWYIGARPSIGKTSLLLQIIAGYLDRGQSVGMFSLEMSRQALLIRLISLIAGVSLSTIYAGTANRRELDEITKAATKIQKSRFYCDDRSGLTASQVRAKARRWRREHKVEMIGVDYLQRMRPSENGRKNRNQSEEHAENSTAMADGVKELGIPWIVLAQLNRECEKGNRKPRCSDFEGTGRIEQDADVALLLSLHAKPSQDPASRHVLWEVAKQRNGSIGESVHLFRNTFSMFERYPVEFPPEPEQEEEPQNGKVRQPYRQ